MNKAAFTLAEVLITLGIIGVVAAMTLPSLVNKINMHHYIAQLKSDYSILSQTQSAIIAEYGSFRQVFRIVIMSQVQVQNINVFAIHLRNI